MTSDFVKLNKGFNSNSYLDLLERAIPLIRSKIKEFVFVQDNAGIHRKRSNKTARLSDSVKFLNRMNVKVLKWPPYSPDLNVIENVWSMLDKIKNYQLDNLIKNNQPLPKNKQQMFKLLQDCWSILDNEKVKNIYFSFLKRIKMCKKLGGGNNFNTKFKKIST